MPVLSKNVKLSTILDMQHFMKIVIDDVVEVDADGNFLINVGYLRVSTDRQAEQGFGLEIQEKSLVNYCRAHGFTNLVLFIDDGYTGTKWENRPALNEIKALIQDFNEGQSNVRITSFIVPRIDRLGRSLYGTLQFIQECIVNRHESTSPKNKNKEDIDFVSVAESYHFFERNNPQGKFLFSFFASLAEFDRDQIVGKLRDGKQARLRSGKWPGGGNIPYGYHYDSDAGTLIIVPEQAEKIREVFRLYIEEKMSPQKIATRLGFKGEKIVTNILKRKSLTGCIIHKGEEYQGLHEPIISLDRWMEAQDEFAKRSVHRGDSEYLLSGLLQCGECGAKMRYQKWNKNGDCKLVCYSTQKSTRENKAYLSKSDDCPLDKFWASDIENAVISTLFEMSYLGNEDEKKAENYYNPMAALQAEHKKESAALNRLYSIMDDDDPDDILLERIQTKRQRLREIERQLSDEAERAAVLRKIKKAKDIFRNLKSAWPHMTPKEKQSVCQELIERVVVYQNHTIDVKLRLRSYLIKQQ